MAEPRHEPPGQTILAAALLDPDRSIPDGVTGPQGRHDDRRFAVYRNNVVTSLVQALGEIFPTIRRLLGEAFFSGMARIHVGQHPPRSPLLFEYGADFPGFLERFEPVADLPYLPDIARLERLWLMAFHAADALPLDAGILSGLAADDLGRLRLVAHPATAILNSQFAIVSILSRDRTGQSLAGINPTEGEIALVTRPDCDVIVSRISPGQSEFITALIEGRPLGEAAGQAQAAEPDIDLAETISLIIQTGCFAGAIMPETLP